MAPSEQTDDDQREKPEVTPEDDSQRVLLKDKAYSEIKQRILDGEYPPGTFLAERRLAEKLDMSKTPIHSAIQRLETEGFVSVSPQQGVVVREVSVHETGDFFDIRIALETFVVQRLAGRISADETDQIWENLEAQREHAEAQTRESVFPYVELDANFHILLCKLFGNQEIVRIMTRQRNKLHRIVSEVLQRNLSRMIPSTEEHVEIAEAVIQGEGNRAAELAEEHLQYGKQFLVRK